MSSHRAFPPTARCRIDSSFSVVDDGVLLFNEALPLPIRPMITQVTATAPPSNNNGHLVDDVLLLDARVARLERMISSFEANRRRMPSNGNGASKKAISDFLMTSSTLCEKSAAADDGGADPDVCSVCLDLYREKQRIGILGCRHRFHAKCIAEWLQINNICPLCKAVGI